MKIVFILSFFICYYSKSFCQKDSTGTVLLPEWVLVTTSSDGDKWYIKSEYVAKDFTGIEIWIKHTEFKTVVKGVSYKNTVSKELDLVDCNYQRLKFMKGVRYNSVGDIIETTVVDEDEIKWIDVVPDSIGYFLVKKVCELFNR